jgi:glutathione S-transferase
MTEIILHHYEMSPYSEKIRVAFGIKRLDWWSVQIPWIIPKPELMPLTGGYRKTPVMQIGADIYCDTQLILREIERRWPEPALNAEPGLGDALGWWAEKALFTPAVIVVFAAIDLPESFKHDRAKFSGRKSDPAAMKAMLPHQRDQLRAHFDWFDRTLTDGRRFLLGDTPGTPDLAAYHCVWFLRRNVGDATAPVAEFKRLLAWADRMAAFGHGKRSEMTAATALDVARTAMPSPVADRVPVDFGGRQPGEKVTVTPDDTGKEPVAGEIVRADAQEIVIRRTDPRVGDVHVHFPRAGFVVSAM